MDLLVTLIVLWWLASGGAEDLVRAWRGQPSRLAEGRARAAATGRRYGARAYLRDLYTDAWRTARARREARVAQRLEHLRAHGPGPTWRDRLSDRWQAAWDRWERRMSARWDVRERTEGRPGPEPVAPTSGPGGGDHGRGWSTSSRPDPGQARPTPGHEQDSTPGGRQTTQDRDDTPSTPDTGGSERGEQDSTVRPGQAGPELVALPLGDGRWVVDPDPQRAGETRERRDDMSEVTGLGSALAHAQEMRRAHEESIAGAEQYLAGLEAGGVSGEAVAAVQQAMEAQQQAAAAWATAEQALSRQVTVREAYAASPGAGSREFVTSD